MVVIAVDTKGSLEKRLNAVVMHVYPGPTRVGPFLVPGMLYEGIAHEYPVVVPVDRLLRDTPVGMMMGDYGAVGEDVVVWGE